MLEYPKSLPLPNLEDYGMNPQSGVLNTEMTIGPSRNRKITANPPIDIILSWKFNSTQYAIFQAWWLHKANMGAVWFKKKIRTGLGLIDHTVRFKNEPYSSVLNANGLWEVKATLETFSNEILTEGALDLLLENKLEDLETAAITLHDCVNTVFASI